MTELQSNTRGHVEHFFVNLSSKQNLINYKNAVPFVRIPIELMAQWDSFMRMKKKVWFKQIWTSNQLKALEEFDTFLNSRYESLSDLEQEMDIPEIMSSKIWQEIMSKAYEAKKQIFGT